MGGFLHAAAAAAAPDCTPQRQVDVATLGAQVVLLNEVHGNVEMPAFAAGLVCSLLQAGRSVILGIEHRLDEQERLNAFLVSDGTPADRAALLASKAWHPRCPDGRTSEAMVALLDTMRTLRRAGERVGVLSFALDSAIEVPMTDAEKAHLTPDDNATVSRIYDRSMADVVRFNAVLYRGYTLVVLTGHAYTTKGYAGDPGFVPMGALLAEAVPTFMIGFESPGGTSWRAGGNGCGPITLEAGRLFKAETKIDAVVRLDALTASPPVFGASR